MDDLYLENILDHFKNPRNYGKLNDPDFEADEENISCGDRIGIQIKLKNSMPKSIEEIKFHGEGCAIACFLGYRCRAYGRGAGHQDVRRHRAGRGEKD